MTLTDEYTDIVLHALHTLRRHMDDPNAARSMTAGTELLKLECSRMRHGIAVAGTKVPDLDDDIDAPDVAEPVVAERELPRTSAARIPDHDLVAHGGPSNPLPGSVGPDDDDLFDLPDMTEAEVGDRFHLARVAAAAVDHSQLGAAAGQFPVRDREDGGSAGGFSVASRPRRPPRATLGGPDRSPARGVRLHNGDMPSLSLHGVSKTYPGGVVGLHSTDLAVESGDRLALLGPSGSGKTTLLRLVAGLEEPDAGEIRIDGVRVDRLPPHRRGVALLPQRPALYPHLTVEQNLQAVRGTEYSVLSTQYSELLHLKPLHGRYPHELSAGERQRAALAKLLARGAGVWLLDEPFSSLDPVFRSDFRRDLHLLLDRCAATIILVTHDPMDALAPGRRIGVLGDGRLQQLGIAEELRDRPGNRFVAFCLGRLSLIDGRAGDSGDSSGWTFTSEDRSVMVPLPAGIARRLGPNPTDNLTLGIRPEDVLTWPPGEHPNPSGLGTVLTGWRVVLAEPVGSGWLLTLARERSRLRVGWPSGSPPPVGEQADWYLPADRCLWFDGTGRRIES